MCLGVPAAELAVESEKEGALVGVAVIEAQPVGAVPRTLEHH